MAKKAIDLIQYENVELIELKNYSRREVNLLLNAVDLALMTSITEGSPQFIKEAMACNCPIVSTNVGDVDEVIKNTDGCYIASDNAADISVKIIQALKFGKRTNGRSQIDHFDNKIISSKIIKIYQQF